MPGTNRFAILIDGYVFKIAMDKDGIRDNLAEFSLSQELQPFVIKVYECNGLIIVTEYVTVISKEEFINSKEDIRHTLSYLAQGYLLGDVGAVTKNFMNWGYRDDNSLVILDFAYIYRVLGEEMICGGLNQDGSFCTEILEYDADFNKLICPKCRKTYSFHDIRRKISKEYENKELETIKQVAYKVTEANQDINPKQRFSDVSEEEQNNTNNGGQTTMSKHNDFNLSENIDVNESYLNAMQLMKNMNKHEEQTGCVCSIEMPETVEEDLSSSGVDSYENETENISKDSYEDKEVEDDEDEWWTGEDIGESEDSEDDESVAEGLFDDDEIDETEDSNNDSDESYNDDCDACKIDIIIDNDDTEDKEVSAPKNIVIDNGDESKSIKIETKNTIILTTEDNVDTMRKFLEDNDDSEEEEDFEEEQKEYDEYEDMYDEIRNDNINRKISQKNKKTLE